MNITTLLKCIFELKSKQLPGTYAGISYDKDTVKRLVEFAEANNISNPLPAEKIHTTLLYSTKPCPKYKPAGKIDPAWIAQPLRLEVWKSQSTDDPKNMLVLLIECEELHDRHNFLMKEHDASYDYPTYKPHITLSYDAGDVDLEKMTDLTSLKDLEISKEYGEDLKQSWLAA